MYQDYKKILLSKINSKKINIGVIGLGYVGLPLAILFAKKGFSILGFDTDKNKIKSLVSNKSYINRIKTSDIISLNKKGEFFNNYKKNFIM